MLSVSPLIALFRRPRRVSLSSHLPVAGHLHLHFRHLADGMLLSAPSSNTREGPNELKSATLRAAAVNECSGQMNSMKMVE